MADIEPSSIVSAEAIGSSVIAHSANLIRLTGLGSIEAFGVATLTRDGGGSPIEYYRRTGDPNQDLHELLEPRDLEPLAAGMGIEPPQLMEWLNRLDTRVRGDNQIDPKQLQLGKLSLSSLGSRRHDELTDVEGGGPGGDAQHFTTQEKLDLSVRFWIMLEG